jgi:hypothetical protein
MTLQVELTQEEERILKRRAAASGLDPVGYLRQLITAPEADHQAGELPPLGSRLLAEWEAEEILGLFSDRPDSPEFVQQLREEAERRLGC